MSITGISWTTEELRRVAENDRLATILLNSCTPTEEAREAKYALKSRNFNVYFIDGSREYLKAVNEESLGWFLEQEYPELGQIAEVIEMITNYVEIPLEKLKLGGQSR